MKTRIKEIRKDAGLSQQEFGKRIGLKTSTIAGYETGSRFPNGAVIQSICHEFHVSKEWLLTGKGEKYIDQSSTFSKLLLEVNASDDAFIKAFIENYMELDNDSRKLLKDMVLKLAKKIQNNTP